MKLSHNIYIFLHLYLLNRSWARTMARACVRSTWMPTDSLICWSGHRCSAPWERRGVFMSTLTKARWEPIPRYLSRVAPTLPVCDLNSCESDDYKRKFRTSFKRVKNHFLVVLWEQVREHPFCRSATLQGSAREIQVRHMCASRESEHGELSQGKYLTCFIYLAIIRLNHIHTRELNICLNQLKKVINCTISLY